MSLFKFGTFFSNRSWRWWSQPSSETINCNQNVELWISPSCKPCQNYQWGDWYWRFLWRSFVGENVHLKVRIALLPGDRGACNLTPVFSACSFQKQSQFVQQLNKPLARKVPRILVCEGKADFHAKGDETKEKNNRSHPDYSYSMWFRKSFLAKKVCRSWTRPPTRRTCQFVWPNPEREEECGAPGGWGGPVGYF